MPDGHEEKTVDFNDTEEHQLRNQRRNTPNEYITLIAVDGLQSE